MDATCSALTKAYTFDTGREPEGWLTVAAVELRNFASLRAEPDSIAAAWVLLIEVTPGQPARALGHGFDGHATPYATMRMARRVQRLGTILTSRDGSHTDGPLVEHKPGHPYCPSSERLLRVVLGDGHGGFVLFIAGFEDGRGRPVAGTAQDGTVRTLFSALARAGVARSVPVNMRRSAIVRSLSDAQRRVFPLLMAGLTEREIGDKLGRSPHTIHDHVRCIYDAFGVRSKHELIARWSGTRLPFEPAVESAGAGAGVVV